MPVINNIISNNSYLVNLFKIGGENNVKLYKKSFNIIKDNPFITLYFVLYLIVLFFNNSFLAGRNIILGMIIGVLILLLTCAFVSGWFNMIKASTVHYKENKTPEEKLEEALKLKMISFAEFQGIFYQLLQEPF